MAGESVTSSGLVTGDDPLRHSLLLLIVQIIVILCFSRFISMLFRPLRQPRVIAEIIGGILLGPTVFGRIPGFSKTLFPEHSHAMLETVAELGLIFFLFLVGLELDLGVLRKTGASAMYISAAGIAVPFLLGVPVCLVVFEAMEIRGKFGLPFILFMGVSLSITAFPVLARILAERKILNTEIGQIAISAAALNDVVAWILLALAVAVTNSTSSPLVVLWVTLLAGLYLIVMFGFVRPLMHSLAKRDPVPETVVGIILMLVLLSSFATDVIGIHVIFGAFIVRLLVPKEKPISGVLIEKLEDFVTIILLPLYFTSSGLKTDLTGLNNPKAVGILVLVTSTAILGKVGGTMMVTQALKKLPLRKSLALGFLMSTKGLVELIVLNIGLSKGVIDKDLFGILVLMAIITTFMTTPIIMWLYKPARDAPRYKRRTLQATNGDNDKLNILVCLHGNRNIPGMMSIIEMTKGHNAKLLKVNVLHLIEFTERSSAIRMAAAANPVVDSDYEDETKDDASFNEDAIGMALRTFVHVNDVNLRLSVVVSGLDSMHEDISKAAGKTRANIVILPFHKHQRPDGSFESMGAGLFHLNCKVMKEAPCSVAVLVDRGWGAATTSPRCQLPNDPHILVLFFGGPDDREALLFGQTMLGQGGVRLTVVHCILGERHGPAHLLRVSTEDLRQYLPDQSDESCSIKRYGDTLVNWGKKCFRWFQAPWISDGHDQTALPSEKVHSPQRSPDSDNSSLKSNTSSLNTTATKDGTKEMGKQGTNHDDVQLSTDLLEEEYQKKEDVKVLGPLLLAAKDVPDTIESKGISVKVVDIEDPDQAMGALFSTEEYSLIIVGLHSNNGSSVRRGGTFDSATDHGLGPVGNFLVSTDKPMRSSRSSLLVVREHRPSLDESLLETTDLKTILE